MVLELCLAWVCVHPLVVAQQAEEGGGNVLLAARGVGCLLGGKPGGEHVPSPGKREVPWGGQCSGFGIECSWGLCAGA